MREDTALELGIPLAARLEFEDVGEMTIGVCQLFSVAAECR